MTITYLGTWSFHEDNNMTCTCNVAWYTSTLNDTITTQTTQHTLDLKHSKNLNRIHDMIAVPRTQIPHNSACVLSRMHMTPLKMIQIGSPIRSCYPLYPIDTPIFPVTFPWANTPKYHINNNHCTLFPAASAAITFAIPHFHRKIAAVVYDGPFLLLIPPWDCHGHVTFHEHWSFPYPEEMHGVPTGHLLPTTFISVIGDGAVQCCRYQNIVLRWVVFNRFEDAMFCFKRTGERPGPLSKNWSNLAGSICGFQDMWKNVKRDLSHVPFRWTRFSLSSTARCQYPCHTNWTYSLFCGAYIGLSIHPPFPCKFKT